MQTLFSEQIITYFSHKTSLKKLMFGVEPPRGCDYEAKHIQSIAQVKNETHTKAKVASGNKLNQCFDAGKNKNNQKSK